MERLNPTRIGFAQEINGIPGIEAEQKDSPFTTNGLSFANDLLR
jgi:hypothetical protein